MVKTTHARDPGLWNRLVNERFAGAQPILSGEESIAAAKRLYRHAMGRAFTGKVVLTSGDRHTWIRRGVLYVNPDRRGIQARGLREVIHGISHVCHSRLHPGDSAHSIRQARLEGRLVTYALKYRFAEGGLKPKERVAKPAPEPKPVPDVVRQRYARMVARRDKWAAEQVRAKRLHAKAQAEVRAYERRHGDRLK